MIFKRNHIIAAAVLSLLASLSVDSALAQAANAERRSGVLGMPLQYGVKLLKEF